MSSLTRGFGSRRGFARALLPAFLPEGERVPERSLCVFVFPPEPREAPPLAPAFILPK